MYNFKLDDYVAKKALVQSQTSPCQICGGR